MKKSKLKPQHVVYLDLDYTLWACDTSLTPDEANLFEHSPWWFVTEEQMSRIPSKNRVIDCGEEKRKVKIQKLESGVLVITNARIKGPDKRFWRRYRFLRPGIKEFLQALKELPVSICAASHNYVNWQKTFLKEFEVLKYFDSIYDTTVGSLVIPSTMRAVLVDDQSITSAPVKRKLKALSLMPTSGTDSVELTNCFVQVQPFEFANCRPLKPLTNILPEIIQKLGLNNL